MAEEDIKKYKRYLMLSLQPLRKKVAESKALSKVYYGMKRLVYKKK